MNWHGCCRGMASTSEVGAGRVVASRTRWVAATRGRRFGATTGGDGGACVASRTRWVAATTGRRFGATTDGDGEAVLHFFGGCCTHALQWCGW